jgi:hypothetical protein
MLSDAQIWEDWLRWLPTAAPSDLPAPIFGQYHKKLLEAGVPEIEADSQIEALVSARGAIVQMPLWGFSLSEKVALSYGRRFLFRLRDPFSAIAPWLHSGIKSAEQEVIGGGAYRVMCTRQEAETLVVDLQEVGQILPEPARVDRLFSAFAHR